MHLSLPLSLSLSLSLSPSLVFTMLFWHSISNYPTPPFCCITTMPMWHGNRRAVESSLILHSPRRSISGNVFYLLFMAGSDHVEFGITMNKIKQLQDELPQQHHHPSRLHPLSSGGKGTGRTRYEGAVLGLSGHLLLIVWIMNLACVTVGVI